MADIKFNNILSRLGEENSSIFGSAIISMDGFVLYNTFRSDITNIPLSEFGEVLENPSYDSPPPYSSSSGASPPPPPPPYISPNPPPYIPTNNNISPMHIAAMTAIILSTSERVLQEFKKGELDVVIVQGKEGFVSCMDCGDVMLIAAADNPSELIAQMRKASNEIRELTEE